MRMPRTAARAPPFASAQFFTQHCTVLQQAGRQARARVVAHKPVPAHPRTAQCNTSAHGPLLIRTHAPCSACGAARLAHAHCIPSRTLLQCARVQRGTAAGCTPRCCSCCVCAYCARCNHSAAGSAACVLACHTQCALAFASSLRAGYCRGGVCKREVRIAREQCAYWLHWPCVLVVGARAAR